MTARETRACGRLGGGCARSGAPDGAGQRTAAPGAPTGFLRGRVLDALRSLAALALFAGLGLALLVWVWALPVVAIAWMLGWLA